MIALVAVQAQGPSRAYGIDRADGDWTTFDYNGQRTGVGPADTEITATNLHLLRRRKVTVDGTVDSSAVALHGVSVGNQVRDVIIVTTSYGKTIAIDPATGAKLWEYVPSDIGSYQGGYQITEASPVVDPDRRYVYAASPDGMIHKLSVKSGQQIWAAPATLAPSQEKISSALNVDGANVVATTSGYFDNPPYDGHVVMISTKSGHVTAVFNAVCSNLRYLIQPRACPDTTSQSAGDSSIWGRSGAVVEPGGKRILLATSNGPFNGSTDWGESALEFSSSLKLMHNWTPANWQYLNAQDLDLGADSPAILPEFAGRRLAVLGGKQAVLRLLDLNRLDGTPWAAGPRVGGELQDLAAPSPDGVESTPLVVKRAGRVYAFVAGDGTNTSAYVLEGSAHPWLAVLWKIKPSGTSPVLAGGLLYLYRPERGELRVLDPWSGRLLIKLAARPGHWNSPIVVGGRVILPEGDANSHRLAGTIDIYHLPGR